MPDSTLKKADSPVEAALILLCEKCGRKLSKSGDRDDNVVVKLQKALKSEFSEAGEKKQFRAVVTTCMNLCPEGTVATSIVSTNAGGASAEFFELDLKDPDEARKQILRRARGRSGNS